MPHDALRRQVSVTTPNAAVGQTSYDSSKGRITTTTDPFGKKAKKGKKDKKGKKGAKNKGGKNK